MLPGSGLLNSEEEAGTLADGIGYPVLLKVTLSDASWKPLISALV